METTDDLADGFPVCDKCGQQHVRWQKTKTGGEWRGTCKAHRTRRREDGEKYLVACKKYPIQGGTVCEDCGGSVPAVRAAANERLAERAMEGVLKALNIQQPEERHLNKSADEQLLEEVARSYMAVEWLAARVAELHVPDPEEGGPLEDLLGVDDDGNEITRPGRFNLYGPNHAGDLGIHPLWKQLDSERDRHARMCKLAIDAGISERMVRLAETQAQQIVAVLVYVIDNLGMAPSMRDEARRLAGEYIRKLGPGGPPGVIDVA